MRARDFTASWNRGQELERKFYEILKLRDKNARQATPQEQYKHIDFFTYFGTIDVKSKKRIGRADVDEQETIVWLEYKNVQGRNGWLVSPFVDILAFERDDDFILVKRKELQQMADELCNLDNMVDKSSDALYKGYTRKGRKDLITQVKMKDVMELEHKVWSKNGI
tara:strand:+ start:2146 stop:2643 length:498 start_codon:yes stop_codon:yes gene_type:complete